MNLEAKALDVFVAEAVQAVQTELPTIASIGAMAAGLRPLYPTARKCRRYATKILL